jgi:hypothetical protein
MWTENSRANDSRNERPPRQTAVRPAMHEMANRPKPSPILLTTRPTGAAVRPGEDRDSDESADEAEIQEHQRPADHPRFVLQEAAEQHGDEGVEDCGGEDADDGAIGGCEAAACFVGDFLDDLDEAGGEEADGNDGRDELDEAQDALEQQVGPGLAEALVCGFNAHGGWLGGVWFGRVVFENLYGRRSGWLLGDICTQHESGVLKSDDERVLHDCRRVTASSRLNTYKLRILFLVTG